jgi:aryl-alcohol dehydrogenase-like predicted oxidoreductase
LQNFQTRGLSITQTAWPLFASRASQLQDNLAALSHKNKMTAYALERIDSIVRNKPGAPRRF